LTDALEPRGEELLGLLGCLAPTIAHEINNPLGVLVMEVDNLRSGVGGAAVDATWVDRCSRQLDRISESLARVQEMGGLAFGGRTRLDLAAELPRLRGHLGPVRLEVLDEALWADLAPEMLPWLLRTLVALAGGAQGRALTACTEHRKLSLRGTGPDRAFVSLRLGVPVAGSEELVRTSAGALRVDATQPLEIRWLALRELTRRWGGRAALHGRLEAPDCVEVLFPLRAAADAA
jgi:hypothetical protein